MFRLAGAAFWLQTLFLAVGLGGMLYVMPHFALFTGDRQAIDFAAFMMAHGGALDMMLGALAMFAYGVATIGMRSTMIFLVVSLLISATAELTGTATGWPFGGYAYTSFLGAKLLGRVPYPIPFSWFSMGFASYLLAGGVTRRYLAPSSVRPWFTVALGAWLLTAWDLVLDPAMANASQGLMHFWVWTEHGAYFGMPLRNLAGWFATGALFIGLARILNRSAAGERDMPLLLPFGMYAVNVLWAMGLAASVGLWQPIVAAVFLGLLPAAAAVISFAKPLQTAKSSVAAS